MDKVQKAYQERGVPKVRVVWGMSDKFLPEAPMFKWAEECRSAFDCMRKVGHMPQEDFPAEAGPYSFLTKSWLLPICLLMLRSESPWAPYSHLKVYQRWIT